MPTATSWKQEVNRRVAAHLGHKTPSTSESKAPQESRPAPDSRAAQAAARVAERYAHAPSYSQMLAEEARAAARAAEAASKAAQQAHLAVQHVLAGIEAATSPDPAWEPEDAPDHVSQRQSAAAASPAPEEPSESFLFEESRLFAARREQEQPPQPAEPSVPRISARKQSPAIAEARADDRQDPASPARDAQAADTVYAGGVAQPIYANVIQFPREMIATRKMRPRRAEGPLAAAAPQAQLSIFEVDPASVSTQPAAVVDEPAAPAWMRTQFESIELEPLPQEELLEETARQAPAPAPMELAPLSRRLLAFLVDASLIAAAFLSAAMLVASNATKVPGPHAVELGAALAVLAIGAAYQTLFHTLTSATPGMRYAGIELSTFLGSRPSRAQRCERLMALPLSVLPLGLGLLWALFDDGHLTWHDRLSRTYLRRR